MDEDTLVLSTGNREIQRYNRHCTHWFGAWWDVSGPGHHYSFSSKEAALGWLNAGTPGEGVREIGAEEAQRGCECRRQGVSPPWA
ncbi:MAG: hypothetical protein ACYCW6_23525 [Candidatus Xenobia bacterium]